MKGRAVRRELLPNQSVELLKTLHLLTREGDLNADARRKLKQVNHLVGLLTPALDDALARHPDAVLLDAGSGNAYLGFILYELFFKSKEAGRVVCVESRGDLSTKGNERAKSLGYARMEFQHAEIRGAAVPERVHVLTALHACDTATDDALALGILKQVDHIAVVPCCQAEVAEQLRQAKPSGPTSALFDHPWHRREFGSHLTNVIRALTLEAFGYQVTVTELAGWEHSLKNELILARRVHKENAPARKRLLELLATYQVRPTLISALAIA